jgi:hypothetical protein
LDERGVKTRYIMTSVLADFLQQVILPHHGNLSICVDADVQGDDDDDNMFDAISTFNFFANIGFQTSHLPNTYAVHVKATINDFLCQFTKSGNRLFYSKYDNFDEKTEGIVDQLIVEVNSKL